MTDSNFLVLSQVSLWVLMLVLYFAVFLIYRRQGHRLLQRAIERDPGGPEIGSKLNQSLTTIDGSIFKLGERLFFEDFHIVCFAKSGCSSCEAVRPFLGELSKQNSSVLVLVYEGDIGSTKKYAEGLDKSVVCVSDPDRKFASSHNLRAVPFAVVAALDGNVLATGNPNDDLFRKSLTQLYVAKSTMSQSNSGSRII